VDVGAWLRGLGLGQYELAFRDNEIDAAVLPRLTAEDLKDLGVTPVGHRRRLLDAIDALRADGGPPPPRSADANATPSPAAAPATQAERRQLTVMFVDLVGSTALSGRLDPEEMRAVLLAYQNTVAGEIARYAGHVAKLMGDGVLAYFGWPRADEDEAERAVRAGLGIAEAVGRLAAPAGEPLAARVGIATGLVVVGDLVGEGTAREEAVVGETPNLAARLQEVAEPGAVVIADGARRLLGEMFELRPLGPVRLKGFARPVGAFRVVGERPAHSRFEARRPGRPSAMVGRDQELALVVERWRQAAAGEGQAVLLVGEAGIGKSRLVRAVLDAVEGDEHTAPRHQCSPHHTGTALWPVTRQLAHAAGLEPADAEAARLDKLEALLRQGVEDLAEAVPPVAALLGIDAGARYPVPDLTPQRRRAGTLAALVGRLLGLARRRPVLMVLEDAHWSDPTTLELVGQVLDRIAGARVLVLLTSRPDGQPALGGHPHVTRLTLTRLGRGPTEAIVAGLAGGESLAPGVLGEIAARTDGVPLFVEELTKAVLETGAAVPASLHASLMARLDRVPGVKEVAQVAACLGREFAYPLLAAVSPVPEPELLAALDRLVAAELVFARGEPPEAVYTFKHALVRDAAHESLLRTRRRELHAGIARVLEERFPATAEAEPELLARHCGEAGLAERAVDYWQRAGQRALARSAMAEAAAQLTNGLEAMAGLPAGPERRRRELGLQLSLGQALIAAKGFAAPEAGRAYARARELCRELGDVAELVPVLYGQYVFHLVRAELDRALAIAEELLRIARERDETAPLAVGHRAVGIASFFRGELAPAREHLERALALYDPRQHRSEAFLYAFDPFVASAGCLSWALFALGHPERARTQADAALARARELAHPASLAFALFFASVLSQLVGDRQAFQERAEALLALVSGQGFAYWAGCAMVLEGLVTGRPGAGVGGRRTHPPGHRRLSCHRGGAFRSLLPRPLGAGAAPRAPSPGSGGDRGRGVGHGPSHRGAVLRGRAGPPAGGVAARETHARSAHRRAMPGRGARGGAPTASQDVGTPGRYIARPAPACPGQAAGGPPPARAGLRLVHRGLRHAGPAGCEGIAR
jgi:class 3 adenylate cyclase/tetratricopeptide (TPR) repeat protein